MTENELSKEIIGAAIEVHKILGPGLLEEVYEEALCFELSLRGIPTERQRELPIIYKGRRLKKKFKLDVLVSGTVIVECKSTIPDQPIFRAQPLTHLRLTDKRLGLLINFGERYLKDGVHRVVNGLRDSP